MLGKGKRRSIMEDIAKELSSRLGISEEDALEKLNNIEANTTIFNSKFIDILATNEKFIEALCRNEKLIDALARKLDFNLTRRLILASGALGVLALGMGTAGAKLVLTDKYVELDGQKFYPASVGAYDAIVMKDDANVWAEDRFGRKIAEREAGIDDATVIQSALDVGGKIYIKYGEYYLNKTITITKNNTKILGEMTKIFWTIKDMSTIPIKIYANNVEIAGFDFRDMYWTCIWANPGGKVPYLGLKIHDNMFSGWGTGSIGSYITTNGVSNVHIYNNVFDKNDDALQVVRGLTFDAENIYIYNNVVKDCTIEIGGWGVPDDYRVKNIYCYNNIITIQTKCAYILISSGVTNCHIYDNKVINKTNIGCYGVLIKNVSDSGANIDEVYIKDNVLEHYSGGAVWIRTEQGKVTKTIIIEDNSFKGTIAYASVVVISYGVTDDVIIKNNKYRYSKYIYDFRTLETDGNGSVGKVHVIGNEAIALNNYYKGYRLALKPSEFIRKSNIYRDPTGSIIFRDENSGIATITGDGVTQTFTVDIAHGLVSDKVVANIVLDRDGTVDKKYLVDADGDGFKETLRIQVTFATAPADGEVVPIYWYAEVVQ